MKSSYKRLGKYIRVVDVRNTEKKEENLLGLSVSKVFIKSIANTIGTDFSTYRVVKKHQFAYVPDTSRRGDKIAIALLDEFEEGRVSQAYTVFEITDDRELLPEYLMMWFRRPEFDRYARFISHGSVREIFEWEDMCNVSLPMPHSDKQREIVKEYKTIVNRIKLNDELIRKLEQTAQTVYEQWFVDFEFPNEEGNPYKSSGGEMLFNEELEKEIPNGWNAVCISGLITVKDGTHASPEPVQTGFHLVTSTHLNLYDISLDSTYRISEEDFNEANKRSKVEKFDILFSMIGTVGLVNYVLYDEVNFAIKNVGLFKTSEKKEIAEYILFHLKSDYMKRYLAANPNGSTQNYVTLGFLRDMLILLPSDAVLAKFESVTRPLVERIHFKVKENNQMKRVRDLLLSRLATIEN